MRDPSTPPPPPSAHEPAATRLPRHFYSLDALRGSASLAVVLWHWQHFLPPGFQRERQPFYAVFQPFYINGWQAVDFFFCLSGFIFFWLYADKIGRRAVSWKQFAVLRLSRLYPLHLATLLFVAVGQVFFLRAFGQYFITKYNRWQDFLLQLAFASDWGFPNASGFNGPVWSVSIEVLLYGIFFLICFVGWRRPWQLLLLVAAGYFELNRSNGLDLGKGLLSFFMGGLTFQLFAVLVRRGTPAWTAPVLGVVTALLWLSIPVFAHPDVLSAAYRGSRWHLNWYIHGTDVIDRVFIRKYQTLPELVTHPLTILTLALWEVRRGTLGKRLAFLGQISYSTYLLHFPLQMVFAALTRWLAVPVDFFYRPAALLLFMAVLIPLSLASFWYFELPCQSLIRARLLPGREPRP